MREFQTETPTNPPTLDPEPIALPPRGRAWTSRVIAYSRDAHSAQRHGMPHAFIARALLRQARVVARNAHVDPK